MRTRCHEADCHGTDSAIGDYCPCKKYHFDQVVILEYWLREFELCKRENGALILWDGAKYITYAEAEAEYKESIKLSKGE